MKRRAPDDPTRKAFEDLDTALNDLGRALLATWPGRQLERFVVWLSCGLEKSESIGFRIGSWLARRSLTSFALVGIALGAAAWLAFGNSAMP